MAKKKSRRATRNDEETKGQQSCLAAATPPDWPSASRAPLCRDSFRVVVDVVVVVVFVFLFPPPPWASHLPPC